MLDAIALTADLVTIAGVLALLAFLLNHPVTKRLGVWAGALRDPYGYGWKRRQRGLATEVARSSELATEPAEQAWQPDTPAHEADGNHGLVLQDVQREDDAASRGTASRAAISHGEIRRTYRRAPLATWAPPDTVREMRRSVPRHAPALHGGLLLERAASQASQAPVQQLYTTARR